MDPQDIAGSESDEEEEMLFQSNVPKSTLEQNTDEESDEETLFSKESSGNTDDNEGETLFSSSSKEEKGKEDEEDKDTLFSSKPEVEKESSEEETLFSNEGDGKDDSNDEQEEKDETLFSIDSEMGKTEDGDEEETLFSTTSDSKEDEGETLYSTNETGEEEEETLFTNESKNASEEGSEDETLFSTSTTDDKEVGDENETLFSSSDIVDGESEKDQKIDFEVESSPLPREQKDILTPLTPVGSELIFSAPKELTPDELTRKKMKDALKKKFKSISKEGSRFESGTNAPETPLSPFVGEYDDDDEEGTLFSSTLADDEAETEDLFVSTTSQGEEDGKEENLTEEVKDDNDKVEEEEEEEPTEDLLFTSVENDQPNEEVEDNIPSEEANESETENLLPVDEGENESEDLLGGIQKSEEVENEEGEVEDLLATSTSTPLEETKEGEDQEEEVEDLLASTEPEESEDLLRGIQKDKEEEEMEDLLKTDEEESEDLLGEIQKSEDDAKEKEEEEEMEDLLKTEDDEEEESEDLLATITEKEETPTKRDEEDSEDLLAEPNPPEENEQALEKEEEKEKTKPKEEEMKESEEEEEVKEEKEKVEEQEQQEEEEYFVDVQSSKKEKVEVVHEDGSEEHIEQINTKLFLAIEEKDIDSLMDIFDNLPPTIFAEDLIQTTKPFRSGNWTPLHYACEVANNVEIVEFLIDKGSEIDSLTSSGCTPLHCAANQGNLEIFHKLIENGADPKKKNEKNWTTLHFAVIGGNFEMVKYLVEVVKIDVKEKTLGSAWTALHFSCRDGNLGMVKLLLSKGADIHARESVYENTPVHAAAFQGKFDVIKYLLWEKGPSILVKKNKQNWTVLHFVVRFRHYKIARYILVEGVQPIQKSEDEAKKKRSVNTMYIQNLGVKRKTREQRRKEAEERKRIEKFKKELKSSIHESLNVQTDKGNTVLHFACRNLDFRMIQLLLLQEHIDRSIRNLKSKLPISYIPKVDDEKKTGDGEEEEEGEGEDGTDEFTSELSSASMIRQVHRLFSTNRKKMMMHVKNEMKHSEQQRQKIDNLYHHLFKKKILTNAIIKTKEKYMVKCHQVMLSRSPYLRKYMTMQVSTEKPVVDIDASTYPRPVIMIIVEWMYGREAKVPPHIFSEVFKLAKEWELLYFQKHLVSMIVEYREDHVLDIAVEETDDDSPLFLQCLQYMKSHYIVYRMGRYQRVMKKNKKLFQKFKKLRTLKIPPALSHREFNHQNLPQLGTIHSQDLYTQHISEYCSSAKVREKWGSITLKSSDKKNFRFHKELLACSSVYFQDLFVKEGAGLPSILSLEYHSFYLESLLKYVYHKPELRVEECISMAMISKDFKLVSSENVFLEKIKTMTTKENLIDIVFKYGHLFFKEESIIKKEIVGIIKNYYDENVIAKLIDQLIGYKLETTKMKRQMVESKNEIKSLTDQLLNAKKEEKEKENKKSLEEENFKLVDENEDLKEQMKEMKDQIRKLKLKVKSFKDLFT